MTPTMSHNVNPLKQRGQYFGAMITIGADHRCRSFGYPESKQTQCQGRDVGQHMSGIRQKSQAIG